MFSNFIEKNGPLVGELEFACLLWSAPVNAPFSNPKSSLSRSVFR